MAQSTTRRLQRSSTATKYNPALAGEDARGIGDPDLIGATSRGPGQEVYLETEEGTGRRIIREELQRSGSNENELAKRPKGEAGEMKISQRLRAERL